MKLYSLIFIIPAVIFSGSLKHETPSAADQVNPIIGNISYEKKFRKKPGTNTSETVRIQTHLEYVEKLLQTKATGNMSAEIKEKRNKLILLLHEYRLSAKFPVNYDYPGKRKPCFIDRNGNICAVGYLVEKTAGRKLAEHINKRHQYDRIADMKAPELLAWIENSGLTKEECAMIQPQYGPSNNYYNENNISHANIITTAAWSGLNLSLSMNGILNYKSNLPAKIPYVSLISGAGQIIYGIASLPKERKEWGSTITNNAQKNVSFVNIGIGATTMFLSGLNYLSKKKQGSKNAYGVYGFPTPDNQTGIAFTYTRKL